MKIATARAREKLSPNPPLNGGMKTGRGKEPNHAHIRLVFS